LNEITENKGNDLQESQLKNVLETYFIKSEIPEELPSDLSTLELTTLNNKYKIKVSEIYDGTFTRVSKSTGKTVAELYDGKNNPNEQNYNEDAMHIGDYIDYDAGNWTETKTVPTEYLTFGGYTLGQSRNINASGVEKGNTASDFSYEYTGWRIWDISDDSISIVSAGCPEAFYGRLYGGSDQNNAEMILTGSTSGTIDSNYSSTPRDWSMYESQYAKSGTAKVLKLNNVEYWENKYLGKHTYELLEESNKLNSMILNNKQYWLGTYEGDDYESYFVWGDTTENGGRVEIYSIPDVFGIRLLINLKTDIKFNETPSKLQEDGYTYNKWTIYKE